MEPIHTAMTPGRPGGRGGLGRPHTLLPARRKPDVAATKEAGILLIKREIEECAPI
jgi:hypothetical protein